MFGAHMPELVLILVGALVIFGPKRLPEIGSGMGKMIRDFKKGVSDMGSHEVSEDHVLPGEPAIVEPTKTHVA